LQASLQAGAGAKGTESTAAPDFVLSLRRLDPLNKWKDEVQEALGMYGNPMEWVLMYLEILDMQGNPAEALRICESVYAQTAGQPGQSLDPSLLDAYLSVLLKAGKYAKVLEVVSPILQNQKDFVRSHPQYVSWLIKRGDAYMASQKPSEALADLDEALAISVDAVRTSKNYGPLIWVLSNVSQNPSGSGFLTSDQMIQKLQARVAADDKDLIAKVALVQMDMLANHFADALKVVETMVAPTDDFQMRYMVLRQSALVRSRVPGQYTQAEKDYQQIEAIAPNSSEVLNNYAFLLADCLHRPAEAVAKARKALDLLETRGDPIEVSASAADVYDTLGWAYCLNNELDKAVDALRKSVKIQPSPAAYYHLAMAIEKQGNKEVASANCDTARDLALAKHDTDTLAKIDELRTKLNTSPKFQP